MSYENERLLKPLKRSPGDQFFSCFVVIGGWCGHGGNDLKQRSKGSMGMVRCKELIAYGRCPKGHTTEEVMELLGDA